MKRKAAKMNKKKREKKTPTKNLIDVLCNCGAAQNAKERTTKAINSLFGEMHLSVVWR